jgi:hypothetical protein
MENNNCRMYEAKYPNAEDLVVVLVKNVAEMGAYVSLLEYNGIEGTCACVRDGGAAGNERGSEPTPRRCREIAARQIDA